MDHRVSQRKLAINLQLALMRSLVSPLLSVVSAKTVSKRNLTSP